jgi:4-hydroxybenzoyl-CoA thioesterase
MSFVTGRAVRFGDCDPAGIVFFPRYLEMLQEQVERWFDESLGIAYAGVVGGRGIGLPTVRLEVDFTAISRLGDRLERHLAVARLGRSSLELAHRVTGGDGDRLRARQVIVCTSLATHRALPWPEDLRAAIAAQLPSER